MPKSSSSPGLANLPHCLGSSSRGESLRQWKLHWKTCLKGHIHTASWGYFSISTVCGSLCQKTDIWKTEKRGQASAQQTGNEASGSSSPKAPVPKIYFLLSDGIHPSSLLLRLLIFVKVPLKKKIAPFYTSVIVTW